MFNNFSCQLPPHPNKRLFIYARIHAIIFHGDNGKCFAGFCVLFAFFPLTIEIHTFLCSRPQNGIKRKYFNICCVLVLFYLFSLVFSVSHFMRAVFLLLLDLRRLSTLHNIIGALPFRFVLLLLS